LTSERARANAGRTPGGEKRMEMLARMGIQGGLRGTDRTERGADPWGVGWRGEERERV
jgi:hypothetical protein